MNKTQFAIVLCKILVLIILMTMLSIKKVNVVGLVLIFIVISYYLWNDTINPLFGKVALFVIAYVLIVATVGFFWNVSIEVPDFGLSMLLSKLDLSKNVVTNKTTVNANKMKLPDSDKYTYSFSIYVKEFATATDPYIFYRNESPDPTSTNKNIGLKLGKSTATATANYDTMQLEYVTGTSTSTSTATLAKMPIGEWTTVTIAVNDKYVNVYVGGNKLTKQLTIVNLKTPSKDAPIQFGNMPVYLANFSHSPSVIEPSSSFVEYLSKTDGIVIQ
jgi:hypothetical protein